MTDKPIPVVDADSREYWEAAGRHELRLPHCTRCDSPFFYPRILCPRCHSDAIEWRQMSGRGVIYSYTVSRRPAGPAFKEMAPYIVALVDLEEGPRLLTNILTDDVSAIRIGQAVSVTFEDLEEGIALPLFQPREASTL
ncbi:Zn-ribbon domain-containing OB-fold protein [Pseudomonas sp. gcc21]|uniref:Zn-ribbon domain-containing OB-fold protein n=1 Tax=Pseudomonas sp. gcc21 TaxID=2726989 RepID=UPI001451E03A|nr:Zn-ribbon domain-containing OB-fold protein [Pseudomonas sp. gcc21]QJD59881.1 Zn-ribbon domain-containing OB-fold protein [Pseudomonas sp. gcc21]